MERNARFWIFVNEWARVTLRPSQTLHYVTGGTTEEGYHVEETTLEYDGEVVTVTTETDARDCDGRVSRTSVQECHVSQLAAEVNEWSGLVVPRWERAGYAQRDYSAEAMGY